MNKTKKEEYLEKLLLAGKIISQKVKTNKEVEEKIRERSSF